MADYDSFKRDEQRLLSAVEDGDVEAIEQLIRYQTNVNARSANDGSTPLQIASKSGNEEIVSLLIKAGADTNTVNNYGISPLHFACTYGNLRIVWILLEHNANTEIECDMGTPLHAIIWNPYSEVTGYIKDKIVRVLLKFGADPAHIYAPLGIDAIELARRQNEWNISEIFDEHGLNKTDE